MERKVELDIRPLLPGIETDEDHCVRRLEKALQSQSRMQRVHLATSENGLRLCLHYDPATISQAEVERLARRAGISIASRFHHEVIPIHGMDCSDCALVVEHSLGRMDGVQSAQVNYVARKVWVEYDIHQTNHHAIERRIGSLGYDVPLVGGRRWLQKNSELLTSLLCGLLVLAGWASSLVPGFPGLLSLVFPLLVYLIGGFGIIRHAIPALRERRFDTDLLMIVAALGAAALGDFIEGGLLIFLFSLGHSLEERALDQARAAIEGLADLAPKTALVRKEGKTQPLPVDRVALGDVVIVPPGTRLPVDGTILAGSSSIDQSPVTGEFIPVDKTVGADVYAGTINGQGALEVRVSRLAVDSTLARVIKLVENAQAEKSPTQQLMERFERKFVPAVLGLTVLAIFVPLLFGIPLSVAFLRAMTLLVGASPCALALGAPAAIMAGVARAAQGGVLVKGGRHLENLGRLKAIAFDKTGTVTIGRPEVESVKTFWPERFSEAQVLGLAGAVESRSAHPLAQAIGRSAEESGIPLAQVSEVELVTGLGLRSRLDGKPVLVGSVKFIEESGILLSPDIRIEVDELIRTGKTLALVVLDEAVIGLVALADRLRPEIKATLVALQEMGIEKTAILTGDNPQVAAWIAGQAGFNEYHAGLMPEDKVTAIQGMLAVYGMVAMVGDGVNDAPALANATLGIAMGGASTDVALETADVALMSDNLNRLPFAIGLGGATRAIIAQNLAIALGVISVLIVAALTGIVSIGVAIAVHEGSTIVVVLNALRLLRYQR